MGNIGCGKSGGLDTSPSIPVRCWLRRVHQSRAGFGAYLGGDEHQNPKRSDTRWSPGEPSTFEGFTAGRVGGLVP